MFICNIISWQTEISNYTYTTYSKHNFRQQGISNITLRPMLYIKAIDFSVGKWSALIKQAKKKQEEQNKTLSHTLQCDENATKEKIAAKDGKYQLWYIFDTIVYFGHLL